ncbi:MAG: hypothetical protein AAF657_30085 [Acidobacteriota bacterium]
MTSSRPARWLSSLLAILIVLAINAPIGSAAAGSAAPGSAAANPILFVTQFPIAADFATIGSTFANHFSNTAKVGRGGDLYILYPSGELCNVTRENGFGDAGIFQGPDSIAVRDPHVHWDGTRALFSMVIGAPAMQFQVTEEYWQLYEVTGLGACGTTAITKVANQPTDYNNLTPIYSPDGQIVFTSDRPRDGRRHLYPQHDEYESTPTNTGLWRLDPASGDLDLMNHAPSGVFTPIVDSFGRIVFTRWDHLQRDQQAENPAFETFTWESEEPDAQVVEFDEIFPEPRNAEPGSNVNGFRINHFFAWQIHPDGTEEETLNHIGRHELHSFFSRSFTDDPNLEDFIASISGRVNPNDILNMFQVVEDPQSPGTYFSVEAPEFQTHASGLIFRLSAPPGQAPDQIAVTFITHPDTATVVADGDPVPATHTGHYRDPLAMADGTLYAAHTAETRAAGNDGSREFPDPRYDFRIQELTQNGQYFEASTALLPGAGIVREIQYYDPDFLVSYNGPMWELQPVEIRSRPTPPILTTPLPAPEAQIFAEAGVEPQGFRNFLRQRELAVVVSRDVTTRDALDRQQPFNLQVPGGAVTTGTGGLLYDVQYMQFLQADQIRGIGGEQDPRPGRRVIAQLMHDPAVVNPPTTGPEASVTLGTDGSMAAIVPAHRAMTWQMTDPLGEPVIRERYWLTFQPGEVRVCASCHGLSSVDQAGQTAPTNPPEALRDLLEFYKANFSELFIDGFESGDVGAWSSQVGVATD